MTELDFSEVYRLHGAFVWRTLRRLGLRPAEVEDACQEVFLVVHRKLAGLGPQPSLEAWLFAICRRVAANHRRRASAQHEQDALTPANEPAAAPTQVDAIERSEARAILDAVLDGLDDPRREVFILFEFERLSMNKIAELVGCPLKTAYARLYSARDQVDRGIRRELFLREQGR